MRALSYLVLSLPLLFFACKKESPVEPTDTTPPPSTGAVVIGPAGGMVSCEGFSMSIPAAAFSSPETLTVKEDPYVGGFGTSNVTGQYRVDGLPSNFSGRLQVAVKCNRTGTSGFFIAMGIDGLDPATGETARLVHPLGAVLDSGFLKTALTPAGIPRTYGGLKRVRGEGAKLARWFVGLDEMDTLLSSGKHFRVFYRRFNEAPARHILQYLEEAYSLYYQMGLGTAPYGRVQWPIDVSTVSSSVLKGRPVGSKVLQMDPNFAAWPYVALACNEGLFSSPPYLDLRIRLIGEFGFLVSVFTDYFFLTPWKAHDAIRVAPRIWPYSAIAQWASTRSVPSGSDSLPPYLAGRKLTPLRGLSPSSGDLFAPHGYGLTGLMKYFAARYGENTLAEIFRTVAAIAPSKTAIDLLFEKVPEEENVWWPAFMKRYLSGEIYGIPADTLLQEMQSTSDSREFTVSGKGDTVKYFSEQYRDLSAKLHRVNLRYADISPTATVTFEVGPKSLNLNYVHVMLFGLKNHKLEYWETGNTVTVTKLKDLTAAGYDIVAAVVNSANESPYNGTMAIDLDVTITSEVLTHARIKVRTNGITRWYDGSTSQSSLMLYNSSGTFRVGTLLNGLFTTRWDTSTSAYRRTGNWTIKVDFSTTPSRVTYFKAEEECVEGDTETWRIEASQTCAITGGKDQYGRYYYKVQGLAVGNHILPVYNRLEDLSTGYWWELASTYFDSDSYIEIILE